METEGKIYRYIVVGTGYINVTTSSLLKGRVLILSVVLGPSGGVEVRRRYQIPCEAPVYSLAPYSSRYKKKAIKPGVEQYSLISLAH